MSMLGSKSGDNPLQSLLGNKDLLSNVSKLFFKNTNNNSIKKIKTTEIDINNYTKVE